MILSEQPRLVLPVERVVQVEVLREFDLSLSVGVLVRPLLVQRSEPVTRVTHVSHRLIREWQVVLQVRVLVRGLQTTTLILETWGYTS
jgi:hypothetical protein